MGNLNYLDLEVLVQKVANQVRENLIKANRLGNLKEVLDKYEYKNDEVIVDKNDNGKLLVIGSVIPEQKNIYKCLKDLGIPKEYIEFCDDYNKLTNRNFDFLKRNSKYSDVLVCAMPHSMKGKSGYNSLINMIEHNQEDYPLLTRVTNSNGNLKFSLSAFKNAMQKTNLYKKVVMEG